MTDPTNTELLVAIQAQRGEFKEHTAEDHDFQDKTMLVHAAQAEAMAEMEGKLATLEAKIDGLATKDDIHELKEFMKNVKIGEGIVKFTWNNAAKIGSFLFIIFVIGTFIKIGFAGILGFFLHKS